MRRSVGSEPARRTTERSDARARHDEECACPVLQTSATTWSSSEEVTSRSRSPSPCASRRRPRRPRRSCCRPSCRGCSRRAFRDAHDIRELACDALRFLSALSEERLPIREVVERARSGRRKRPVAAPLCRERNGLLQHPLRELYPSPSHINDFATVAGARRAEDELDGQVSSLATGPRNARHRDERPVRQREEARGRHVSSWP